MCGSCYRTAPWCRRKGRTLPGAINDVRTGGGRRWRLVCGGCRMPDDNTAANTAHLVIVGASGDLTARYLVPALAELWNQGHLDEGFRVLGIARDDWSSVT